MSIQDDEGRELLTVGKLQAAVFKLACWFVVVGFPAFALHLLTQRDTIRNHEYRIHTLEKWNGITYELPHSTAPREVEQAQTKLNKARESYPN